MFFYIKLNEKKTNKLNERITPFLSIVFSRFAQFSPDSGLNSFTSFSFFLASILRFCYCFLVVFVSFVTSVLLLFYLGVCRLLSCDTLDSVFSFYLLHFFFCVFLSISSLFSFLNDAPVFSLACWLFFFFRLLLSLSLLLQMCVCVSFFFSSLSMVVSSPLTATALFKYVHVCWCKCIFVYIPMKWTSQWVNECVSELNVLGGILFLWLTYWENSLYIWYKNNFAQTLENKNCMCVFILFYIYFFFVRPYFF